jgi:hypothetical protein
MPSACGFVTPCGEPTDFGAGARISDIMMNGCFGVECEARQLSMRNSSSGGSVVKETEGADRDLRAEGGLPYTG